MDIIQLLLTAGLAVGVLLVGLMAVVPTAMEAGSDSHPGPAAGSRPTPPHARTRPVRSPAVAVVGPGRG